MPIQHGKPISLEEFFALLESDPEHRYEYIDGYAYMMTGGTPDHSIIGANMNRILGEQLRKRPCIVYPFQVLEDPCDPRMGMKSLACSAINPLEMPADT